MSTIARQWYCQDKPKCGHWNVIAEIYLIKYPKVNAIDNIASDMNQSRLCLVYKLI